MWAEFLTWTENNKLTLLTLAGSVIAFGYTVWQGLYTRLNARISALPLLYPHQEAPIERLETPHVAPFYRCRLRAKIVNGGLGPAIITKYEVRADGKPINLVDRKEVAAVVIASMFGLNPANVKFDWYFLESEAAVAVPKDQALPALTLTFDKSSPFDCEAVVHQIDRFAVRIEYQSMHGDELLFDSTKASLPPNLGLFRRHKRKRVANLLKLNH